MSGAGKRRIIKFGKRDLKAMRYALSIILDQAIGTRLERDMGKAQLKVLKRLGAERAGADWMCAQSFAERSYRQCLKAEREGENSGLDSEASN